MEKYPNRDEIIRKIRNFNDFINAVKKELNEKRSNEDSVRIKMHIENQAFDIDKYRNLFEKEVARKYGISTINVSEDRNQPVKYLDLQMAHPR
ncbi:MAG: hypothetical protein JST59_02725 [Actinobacteria bacterium]|nr:hypothetical protein [Actinomycetota bacterium]